MQRALDHSVIEFVSDDEYYSPFFLDCCGLVRRVMRDLRADFGFRLGSWNQGYMYDLLPIEYDDSKSMQPGDLVFVEGVYYDEKSFLPTAIIAEY